MNSRLGFGPPPMSRYSSRRMRFDRACHDRLRIIRESPMLLTRPRRVNRTLSNELPTRAPVPAATAGDVSGAARALGPVRVRELGPVLVFAFRVLPHHATVDG